MPTSKDIAGRFEELDFHDDTFVSLTVLPAQTRDDVAGSIIELRLAGYKGRVKRLVQFIGCANLRTALDFDVLADNLPPNTARVEAHADAQHMTDLMQSQMRDWDRVYNPWSPLDAKLVVIDELVCFRVQFFGGAVDIIAREFLIETTETPTLPCPSNVT